MANMSYCRFHNTLLDLEDCIEALESREASSQDEKNKAERLILSFLNFLESEGVIDEYETDRVDEFIQEIDIID